MCVWGCGKGYEGKYNHGAAGVEMDDLQRQIEADRE